MKHADFVHLHTHTQYSLLDGACRLKDLVDRANEFKMPSLAITDHGNMFGAIEFYSMAKGAGIKPIIGAELYMAPESRFDKSSRVGEGTAFHIILLAKNMRGYQNLMKLVSTGFVEGFYYKPRIDKEILAKHCEGLIALTACLKGEIPSAILRGKKDYAVKLAGELNEMFGKGNFYFEIQHNLIPEQDKLNKELISLSKTLSIPLAATNDIHYLRKEDARAHEILLCLQTQTKLTDEKRLKFQTDEFYFKSPDEMKRVFAEVPEAILNTVVIAEKCGLELEFGKVHLPKYDTPAGMNEGAFLRKLCEEGVEKRFGECTPQIKNRLEHELKVIEGAGFNGYFLLVWDFVHFAKQQKIPVGPGRGSAAGSLVAYVLGVTDIDPLKYDLVFERFLNPERISFPDIDIDFCYERRDEVIKYVTEKYGQDKVAQIITFGTMAARGVIRDVGRVMDMSYGDVDKIAKLVPADPNMNLDKALQLEPQLKSLYDGDPAIKSLINTSKALEGLTRHASTHAAGIIISRDALDEYIPLFKTPDGQLTTGYAMGSLEKLGLLKMDFLGLRTLTVMDETVKIIKRTKDKEIDLFSLPLDDKKTFKLLSKSESLGVFQLESTGMRDLLRKLKPEQFEDIVALLALFRPGPLGSGLVEEFIKRKHGEVPIEYPHPKLESILKETYGVLLHQDQIMVIGIKLAGFSFGQADILMRAIGKKQPEKMQQMKEDFLKGAVAGGIKPETAEEIFTLMAHFTGYGFNKSHTTAYAMIAYQTAYLKANYGVEFMTALLSSEKDNTSKIAQYIEESKRMGIKILPPDVNESYAKFTVVGNSIRFGLSAVKNVGAGAIESIVNSRKEKGKSSSFTDFCERIDSRLVNKKVMESLIKCGAFDGFGPHRSQLMAGLDNALNSADSVAKDRQKGQLSFFDGENPGENFKRDFYEVPQIEEWPEAQRLAYEKEMIGFYITGHPLERYQKALKTYNTSSIAGLSELSDGKEVIVGGVISRVRNTVTKKKGEKMAILRLEDLNADVEVLVFPRSYAENAPFIKEDEIVFIRGKLDAREEVRKVIASDIIPIKNMHEKFANGLIVNLTAPGLQEKDLHALNEVLKESPGSVAVFLNLDSPNGRQVKIKLSPSVKVKITQKLIFKLKELYGEEAVSFRAPSKN
ncbi:MAG: DNA polymerase III subunit alpha [Candidatus Omnitrophota bacterium]